MQFFFPKRFHLVSHESNIHKKLFLISFKASQFAQNVFTQHPDILTALFKL